MKKRNQFIKRIGAFLCAVVVAVSCVGVASPYFADSFSIRKERFEAVLEKYSLPHIDMREDLNYAIVYSGDLNQYVVCGITKNLHFGVFSRSGSTLISRFNAFGGVRVDAFTPLWSQYECFVARDLSNGKWNDVGSWTTVDSGIVAFGKSFASIDNLEILYSDVDIYYYYSNRKELGDVFYDSPYNGIDYDYNSSLGYLQNIERKTTYIRGALYNYDEDSKTYHWYHDLETSSGIDLSSGDYVIRHYVSIATVKGYEKSDIVEMTDKWLMAEYDASNGYFSYLDKDYMDKMYSLGYEDIGFFDSVFRGYFRLQHDYFQIVNTTTNEVGGYLHLYPRDADPDNFGVELEYEGLDNNFEVDSDAPSGNSKPSTGSGETIEDALVNADEPKLDDLQGVDEFIDNLEMYSVQIKGVVGGVSAFLGMFPPWLIGLVGFSLVMPFVVIVIKALRG